MLSFDGKAYTGKLREEVTSHMELGVLWDVVWSAETLSACTCSCWRDSCLLPVYPNEPKSKLGMRTAIWPGYIPTQYKGWP